MLERALDPILAIFIGIALSALLVYGPSLLTRSL